MAPKLLVLAFSGLVGQAAALRVESSGCPSIPDILEGMEQHASESAAQITGCRRLAFCINLTSAGQDEAVALGSLNASIKAMQQFPDDLLVQSTCISATARPILFNRPNALLAGRLGGLNLTLAAFRRWMDVPRMAMHGGDIGAFLTGCDENLAIMRELDGLDMLMQNIRNHFHGNLSDWAYKPVQSSLAGLAAGCWRNTDICYFEGFVQLAVQLMDEHPDEGKIAAEALEAVKAMMFEHSNVRREFSRAGLMPVLAKVLKGNSTRRARSSACEAMSMMTGPLVKSSPLGGVAYKVFEKEIQANATRDGVLDQLLATVMSEGVEGDDIVQAECIGALMRMGWENDANVQAIRQTGLPDRMEAKLTSGGFQALSGKAACAFFSKPGLAPAKNTSDLCLRLDCGFACASNHSGSDTK